MNAAENVIYSIQQTLTLLLLVLALVCIPILCIAYWRYRRHPILKARRCEWVIVNQVLLLVGVVAYGYDAWRHYPTRAEILFTNSVVTMMFLDSHIIRCWMLLYSWNVSKSLCSMPADEKESGQYHCWWIRHTYLASGRMMALLMVVLTIFHLGCWLLFVHINGWDRSWNEPAQAQICTSGLLWFFGVWGVMAALMALALYLSYNMRLVVDAFEIKTELMTCGGIWMVGAMPFWLLDLLFPSLEHNLNYIIMLGLAVAICSIPVAYLSLVKPLRMIYHETHRPSFTELSELTFQTASDPVFFTPTAGTRDPSRSVDLRKMLDTNTGIAGAFVHFLTKEFSVENWAFYSEVLQLRMIYGGWKESDAGRSGLRCGHLDWFKTQGPALRSLESRINQIYAMYLARAAPFEINLGSERMHAIRACFGPNHELRQQAYNEISELLCGAQDEIYELMRTDSYERFKRTDDFDQGQLALV